MINPLFLTPPGATVESSPFPQPVPGSHWRTCKVSIQYLENCANACRIYVCWVINPLFLSPTGTVESSTPPRSVPESRWRICKVSTLCLENCANACWIYVFFEWLTLYFWAPRGTLESSTPPRSVPESFWRICEVSTLCLENCSNACWIYVFLGD